MNFLKSSWSYLSNSFTQSEGDEEESNSVNISNSNEQALNVQDDLDIGNQDNETNEFVDAVDIASDDLATHSGMCNMKRSHEISVQIRGVDVDCETSKESTNQSQGIDLCGSKSSDSVSGGANDKECLTDHTTAADGKGEVKGYTTLGDSDSDSDDIVALLSPPSRPVGPREDTEAQLNQIINNLGDDLAVLEIDHGHLGDNTLNGESTFGETLYLTACDKTVCATSEQNLTLTLPDSTTHLNGSLDPFTLKTSDLRLKTSSEKSKEARPSTPLFRNDYFDSDCNTPTNQSYDSTSLNGSVVIAKNYQKTTPYRIEQRNGEPQSNDKKIVQVVETFQDPLTITSEAAREFDKTCHQKLRLKKDFPTSNSKMDDPVDEIPIARGSYTLDFDSLDNFNPFQTSKGLQNSPDLPSKSFPHLPQTNLPEAEPADTNNHIVANEIIANSIAMNDVVLAKEDKAPESSEILNNHSTDISERDKDLNIDIKNTEESMTHDGDSDAIPASCGAYTIDFDHPDSFDPFKTSKGLMNSPTKTSVLDPFTSSKNIPSTPPKSPVKNATPFKNLGNNEVPVSNITSETNKGVEENRLDSEPLKNLIIPESGDLENVDPKPKKLAKKPVLGANRKKLTKPNSLKKRPPPVNVADPEPQADGEEDIIIPKGSYSVNFDDLDSMDPFRTSKGLSNSPTKTMQDQHFNEVPIKECQNLIKGAEVSTNQPDRSSEVSSDQMLLPDVTAVEPTKTHTEQDLEDEQKIPIPKGSYSIDFANLDNRDPFKTSKGLANSPTGEKPSGYSLDFNNLDATDPFKASQTTSNTPSGSPNLASQNTEPAKKSAVTKKKVKKPVTKKTVWNDAETKEDDDDDIPVPKGSYYLDFDNLDAMDPFKTGKGLSNSPTEKKTSQYSFDLDNLDNNDPFKPSKAMANSPPPSPTKQTVQEPKPVAMLEVDSGNTEDSTLASKTKVKSPAKNTSVKKKSGLAKRAIKKPVKKPPPVNMSIPDEEDENPVPKGSYNLDFDNLDSMDPFKTSKGLANSPTEKKLSGYSIDFDNLDNVDPFKSKKAISNSLPLSPAKNNVMEDKVPALVQQERTEEPNEMKSAETKKPHKKELARKKLMKPSLMESAEDKPSEPPIPRGSYDLDLNNLDAMDPFKSTKAMANSPTKESPQASSDYSVESKDCIKVPIDMRNSPSSSPSKSDIFVDAKAELVPEDDIDGPGYAVGGSAIDQRADKVKENVQESRASSLKTLQKEEFEKINENEEFYPASNVFQDSASLNFLDKLADTENFNECKLRKQSLYVKFDPLVSASPTVQIENQLKKDAAALKGIREVDEKAGGDAKADEKVKEERPKQQSPPNVSVDMDTHSTTGSYGQTNVSRESTSFKHTQVDFEAALREAEQKWQKEREEQERREKSFQLELDQMTQVVSEYDRLFAEMANNGSRNGMLTREQQLLTAEHEQTLEDMAALERSHEDLCRRYNRLKTVVAQFKQNEEILKASTNQMVQEAKEAEKKYVTLKIQTDETVKKANEELQSVKSNAQQEVARAQAQLKLLELKCESLQNQVRECSKENEELTKLCDDLIACSKQDG